MTFTRYHSTYAAHALMSSANDAGMVRNLAAARVEMKPHQVDAAMFGLRSPFLLGAILADEVGLGKTIEAALVMAQLWAEKKRKIILICPASLRPQWAAELTTKFDLPNKILDTKTWKEALAEGLANPFNQSNIIIVSYEFAAKKVTELAATPWDLVVLDEAHRLRSVYKADKKARSYCIRAALASRRKLLLTATPLQNNILELYGLVSLIDAGYFGTLDQFKLNFAGAGRSALASERLKERLKPIFKRTLRKDVEAAGHVRYTKRIPTIFDVSVSTDEKRLYDALDAYMARPVTFAFQNGTNALLQIQARRILGSSVRAIEGFLDRLIDRVAEHTAIEDDAFNDLIENAGQMAEELADAIEGAAGESSLDDDATVDDQGDLAAGELKELIALRDLARAILASHGDTKATVLANNLPRVLDEVVKNGGKRKAVIFTESTRTQAYLAEYLESHGFAGEIVLMNGSNSDAGSAQIYRQWLEKHRNSDCISGVKSSDMKAAIVDAFRGSDKTLLLSTESGAEGINLQFCSIVVNFDLPWNPQRVEQRIGRCHRYGQEQDVTVISLINRANEAEQRVYDLMNRKLNLFGGIFGASDEILGQLESAIDLERRIVEIVRTCRKKEAIAAAFDRLESEIAPQIDAELGAARATLLDSMDRDVVARLQAKGRSLTDALDGVTKRLLQIARCELPAARFHPGHETRFDHDGQTFTTEWPLADDEGWHFFRLGEGTLAQKLVDAAKTRVLPVASLTFNYAAYRENGSARLMDIEALAGQSGWLRGRRLVQATPAADDRISLLVCGVTDDGQALEPSLVDRLFDLPARVGPDSPGAAPAALDELEAQAKTTEIAAGNQERQIWLDEETERLEALSHDLERALQAEIDEIATIIKQAQTALRANQALSTEEKLDEKKRILKLQKERDALQMSMFIRKSQILDETSAKLDELTIQLHMEPTVSDVMTIRFDVTA